MLTPEPGRFSIEAVVTISDPNERGRRLLEAFEVLFELARRGELASNDQADVISSKDDEFPAGVVM